MVVPASLEGMWNDALAIESARLRARDAEVVVVHASEAARDAMGTDFTAPRDTAGAVELGRAQGREVWARAFVESRLEVRVG